MSTWVLLVLLSFVSCQLDLPPLENNRNDFGRRFPPTETELQNILARLDFLGTERCSANIAGQWAYETDVNEYTQLQAASTESNDYIFPIVYEKIAGRVDSFTEEEPT